MSKTRFMTVLFSATEKGDEELTNQVHEDIQKAKENGSFEDDEMKYKDLGDNGVLAIDKENGEQTLIHNEPVVTDNGDVVIDLEEVPDYCIEDQSHPEVDVQNNSIVVNPMEEKEFSVTTNNTAVLKIFSDQDLVEVVSESVSRTEQEAQVGDLKFEKDSEDDGIIVTDVPSGDKAKVVMEGDNMKVTELDQKNFKYYSNKGNMNVIKRKVFSHAEQYEPIFVVGIDPINKVLVNSPVYGEAAANDLAQKLMERGIMGVNVFVNPDEGREYALGLLSGEGATEVAEEEEMEVAYSDNTVIANRYFSDRTRFMSRLFSEAEENVTDHQDLIESAIADGDQMETEDFIITPVSDDCAVVEDKDNGEYTVAELDGKDINVDKISAEQAQDMMKDIQVEDSEEEKEFSDKPYRKCYGLVSKVAEKVAKVGQKTAAKGKEIGAKVKDAKTLKEQEKLAAKANKLMTKGEKIEKNAGTIAKVGLATAAAAGAAGAGTAGYKLTKKQKDNSDVDESTLAQIEDSSVEAIQNVQEAAETAIEAINQAKEAPVEEVADVKEATYSETEAQKQFSEVNDIDIPNPSLAELNW